MTGVFHGLFTAVTLLLMATTAPAHAQVHVVDGDTIDIGIKRYRIYGVDAPEAGQSCLSSDGSNWQCGKAATEMLRSLVDGASVTCADMALDDYGRMLAICEANGIDLGETLITNGLAWAFRRYGNAYNDLEDAVRSSGMGIWQAETEAPWEYRARRWKVEEQVVPDGCPIKGNINRSGERIYHTPWSPSYANTKITPDTGERWFCDEAEASEAGWRAPYSH